MIIANNQLRYFKTCARALSLSLFIEYWIYIKYILNIYLLNIYWNIYYLLKIYWILNTYIEYWKKHIYTHLISNTVRLVLLMCLRSQSSLSTEAWKLNPGSVIQDNPWITLHHTKLSREHLKNIFESSQDACSISLLFSLFLDFLLLGSFWCCCRWCFFKLLWVLIASESFYFKNVCNESFSWFIHPSMDSWVVSGFGQLWWSCRKWFSYRCMCGHLFSFFWLKEDVGVELLGHMISECNKLPNFSFSFFYYPIFLVTVPFWVPRGNVREFHLFCLFFF